MSTYLNYIYAAGHCFFVGSYPLFCYKLTEAWFVIVTNLKCQSRALKIQVRSKKLKKDKKTCMHLISQERHNVK